NNENAVKKRRCMQCFLNTAGLFPLQNKPVRRRPPRTLQLPLPTGNDAGQDHGEAASHPPRKNRNSALIEKLQANLVLSPTALLPSPLSPGAGKPPVLLPSLSPNSPCSPASPAAAHTPRQEEAPASFEKPAEGSVLLNVNKSRARHSIKRRPPSRRHRKSSGDDVGTEEEKPTAAVSESPSQGGKEEEVFEEQKVEKKEGNSAEPAAAAEEKKEEKEEVKTPDEPQLTTSTSESTKHEDPHEEPQKEPTEEPATEPQSESERAPDDKEEQKEKKEEGEENQTEVRCYSHCNKRYYFKIRLPL
uniref:FAM21/CAPZIP domain-containing protein n=1 Tax=Astyanax mexicanus TaxID=7994 RepID=A0A3B1K4Y6_ASTMX